MKKFATLALGAMLGAGGMAGGAHAAADIKDGAMLIIACQSLLDDGSAEGSKGAACKDFVTSMILTQEDSLNLGEPFKALRLGPNQDEKACFEMPNKLTYRDFAGQVVSYADSTEGATELPAYELAVKALEKKYPCDPEDLKNMEDADSPAE